MISKTKYFDRLKKIQNENQAEKLQIFGIKIVSATRVFNDLVGSNEVEKLKVNNKPKILRSFERTDGVRQIGLRPKN